jgi:hypothetical protein
MHSLNIFRARGANPSPLGDECSSLFRDATQQPINASTREHWMKPWRFAAALAIAISSTAGAVSLSPDGLGQALIFPYYTAQSVDGAAFNTYLSISNTTSRAKALKIRIREGKFSRGVLAFNIYLGPQDSWAAAIVPDGEGARIVTTDTTCTAPMFLPGGVPLRDIPFQASDDGAGTGLDRTREGYVEVIEMGQLTGTAAESATHASNGRPVACTFFNSTTVNIGALDPPGGGLSGSGTLINVATGLDGTYDAEALDHLASVAFFTGPGEQGTDFNAAAVDPVSHVVAGNTSYRLTWSRGVDAVSSVLMAARIENDFILDAGTRSATDWVMTFPTRRFYVTTTSAAAPFTSRFGEAGGLACEGLTGGVVSRDPASGAMGPVRPQPPGSASRWCWSATVIPVTTDALTGVSRLLGSRNLLGFAAPFAAREGYAASIVVPEAVPNGRMWLEPSDVRTLVSNPDSQAIDLRTGAVTQRAFGVRGVPVTGFMVRSFLNGTLSCGAGACQGNYGGLFKHRRVREIAPP